MNIQYILLMFKVIQIMSNNNKYYKTLLKFPKYRFSISLLMILKVKKLLKILLQIKIK